jgi:2-dehydro-3-deoxygluconokinase
MKRAFRSREIVGVGEAMIEFAAVGDDLYRRGFAGDTLNTCWHLAQLLGSQAQVGYATRVGGDAFSQAFVDFLGVHGLDAAHVQRDAERAMGLYVISLAGAERSFAYWRDASAARGLADDPGRLAAAMATAALIHVSGITLAVIGAAGRRRLIAALADARAAGAVVSFDPNVRLRLWADVAELKAASEAMFAATDIALPSFDDEALVWGDADPDATLARIAAFGVEEIVVKNGAGEVALRVEGRVERAATPPTREVRDTTGAGDSFNAGYLAARFVDLEPLEACAVAHGVAAATIACFGALPPAEALAGLQKRLAVVRRDIK